MSKRVLFKMLRVKCDLEGREGRGKAKRQGGMEREAGRREGEKSREGRNSGRQEEFFGIFSVVAAFSRFEERKLRKLHVSLNLTESELQQVLNPLYLYAHSAVLLQQSVQFRRLQSKQFHRSKSPRPRALHVRLPPD
jgi:hypothetical protein